MQALSSKRASEQPSKVEIKSIVANRRTRESRRLKNQSKSIIDQSHMDQQNEEQPSQLVEVYPQEQITSPPSTKQGVRGMPDKAGLTASSQKSLNSGLRSTVLDRALNFSNVQCPYCSRTFSVKAGQRHIDYCREKYKLESFKQRNLQQQEKQISKFHQYQSSVALATVSAH
mmetsp:Transcript_2602/g.4360  ORF Transcript_2602/g.4360 Transcript_2602/m.4360 type:complete len:172 (-) Transcript_2602:634-1149(-)